MQTLRRKKKKLQAELQHQSLSYQDAFQEELDLRAKLEEKLERFKVHYEVGLAVDVEQKYNIVFITILALSAMGSGNFNHALPCDLLGCKMHLTYNMSTNIHYIRLRGKLLSYLGVIVVKVLLDSDLLKLVFCTKLL